LKGVGWPGWGACWKQFDGLSLLPLRFI
jgi:hypothetical protein